MKYNTHDHSDWSVIIVKVYVLNRQSLSLFLPNKEKRVQTDRWKGCVRLSGSGKWYCRSTELEMNNSS